MTGEDTASWDGYPLRRSRRAFFKRFGATATDHGHASARTTNLPPAEAEALFSTMPPAQATPSKRNCSGSDADRDARMSLDDGLVMQIHPGSRRNHSPQVMSRHGRDMGFDIPGATTMSTR